jgi:ABC-type dipeptide/oligopeptide/nickel transport system permease component
MGLEIVYFAGALVLLVALIYGTLSYRYRNRSADRVAEDIVRDRYRKNET